MLNVIASATITAVVIACAAAAIYGIVSWTANYMAREDAIDVKLDYWENISAGY